MSFDLHSAFPDAKGFSARNLRFMKQWYFFYDSKRNAINEYEENEELLMLENKILNQVGSVIKAG